MKLGTATGFWCLVVLTCSCAAAAEHTKDTLDQVRERVANQQAVLVDVRETAEWKAGHLADAQLVPLSALAKKSTDPEFVQALARQLDKDKGKIVYCHCKAGGRCLLAADVLKKLGYDVRPLKPGYTDLIKAGFKQAPPERSSNAEP